MGVCWFLVVAVDFLFARIGVLGARDLIYKVGTGSGKMIKKYLGVSLRLSVYTS